MKSNNKLKSLAFQFATFRIRKPLLYPLSYGGWCSPCGNACPIGCIYILETCNGVKIIFETCVISAPNYPNMLKYIEIS